MDLVYPSPQFRIGSNIFHGGITPDLCGATGKTPGHPFELYAQYGLKALAALKPFSSVIVQNLQNQAEHGLFWQSERDFRY
ncbi:MAG: hypothetical protein ACR2PI_12880 [Hyphomicrobiaceae bacterium]